MEFNFFIGCTSIEDVKSKYRSLAKIHHPDKGGNSASFVALSNEYSHIISNAFISFPIGKVRKAGYTTVEVDMSDVFAKYGEFWKEPKPDYERARQAQSKYKNAYQEAQDLAERQRQQKIRRERELREEQEQLRKDPWHLFKKSDSKYSIIEQLIIDGTKSFKTTKWFLMEVYKLDELGLKHFEFIRDIIDKHSKGACKLTDSWISESYRNYVTIQQMEWRY